MQRLLSLLSTPALGLVFMVAPVHGATFSETFDAPVVLSSTQAPGAWYTDRYNPSGFSSAPFAGDNRLKLDLSAADGAANRPPAFSSSFYNTQGRKFDTPGPTTAVSVQMYIDPSFVSDPNRVGGLWATGVDAGNSISLFPIIEFQDGQFKGWNNGTWVAMGLPAGFTTGQFYTLGIVLDALNDMVNYTVNGQLLTSVGAFGTTHFANVIIQGINTQLGLNRTLYFDNLNAMETPLPGALALFASALVGFGFLGRRKLKKNSEVAA